MFRTVTDTDILRHLLNDTLPNGGLVAMLKVYMDTAAKPEAGRIMTATAALFSSFQYDFFLHEWQPILDEWGAKAFHATDFYPGGKGKTGDFRRKFDGVVDQARLERYERHSRLIPEVIARHVKQLFVVSFSQGEYERVAPEAWRKRFGGVYRVAAQALTHAIGHWADKVGYDGEILYFYESGDRDEKSVKHGYEKAFQKPKQRQHTRMAALPIGLPKGKAHGLEVADFLAWQWNKHYVNTKGLVVPKDARKDVIKLMNLLALKEEQILIYPMVKEALDTFLISHGCVRVAKPRGA